jgi:acetylornithine deacetylase/succinyl-diaminopimelate desuccinylase-like protein
MIRACIAAAAALAAFFGAMVDVRAQDSDEAGFRRIYRQLVEINTTASAGDCTVAARAMAQHLAAAGLADADLQVLVPPNGPRKGNLVARLRGKGPGKPILLLAHIDVVEAHRDDWKRDPFKLVEEDGYFYARGAADNKAMAAAFVHNLIRYRREGWMPQRDLVLALTCDEEIIPSEYNGVEFLLKNHRSLIDAELALNEGGSGLIGRDGQYRHLGLLAGEKVFQTYYLEAAGVAGHSARPSKDNAIYHVAEGLARLAKFDFPFRLNEVTRTYLERAARFETGARAAAMQGLLLDPPDPAALAYSANDPALNSIVRTTCVATMMLAGQATNALPQRARAVVNCRILPGEPVEEVALTLAQVLANDKIRVTAAGEPVTSPAPPLSPRITGAVERVAGELWPGVPVIPTMAAGATDGRFLNNAGIPTYGVSGMFHDIGGSGVHGLDERIRVKSVLEGREFLYRLVKELAGAPR